jgi:ABC-2 type transport system ATP-binding protein
VQTSSADSHEHGVRSDVYPGSTSAGRMDPPTLTAPESAVAVRVDELRKSYGAYCALAGVSFNVCGGEVFGILGPNGAGKTTLLEILAGLRQPSSGNFQCFGQTLKEGGLALRRRIGVVLQGGKLPAHMRVKDIVELHASIRERSVSTAEVLEPFALESKANARLGTLSGGQSQRLLIALALIGSPDLLLFDEPTSSLDPHARRKIWDTLASLAKARSSTIILSTHAIAEARVLCDRVAILDHGQIVASASPQELVDRYCPGNELVFSSSVPSDFTCLGAEPVREDRTSITWLLRTNTPALTVAELMQMAHDANVTILELRLEGATLEDVFLRLTGRAWRD